MKPGRLAFVLLVTTRTNKQRQGLNLYGCFFQMASDLRRRRIMYPNRLSYICFQASIFFFLREKNVSKEFGIQGGKCVGKEFRIQERG